MFSSDVPMRMPPSVVAATTGSASRETRRVLMRQLRSAIREPGPLAPFDALGLLSAASLPGA